MDIGPVIESQTFYTIQLGQWRKARDLGIPLVDVTVKSGNVAFAPTWENLKLYKDGKLTDDEYTERYLEQMRITYHTHRSEWIDLLSMPKVAIACYCPKDAFCHRHILKKIIAKLHERRGTLFIDGGEIS